MLPLLIKMTIPSIVAQLVNLLYSIVDRIYIGRIPEIGTDALAGVGVTSSIIMLISAFSSFVGIGGAPLAAVALGKGDRERAGKILGNGFVMLIFFAIMAMTLTYIFMEPLLNATGASSNTIGYSMDYLSIYLIGTIFVMFSTGLVSYVSAQGRPKISMISVVIGAGLNIILDPIFIYGLDMGVSGAALATIIAQCASSIWVLAFLFSERATLRIEKKYMKINWKIVAAVCAMGISPFAMSITESLVGFVLNGTLETYGDIYVSTLTVLQSAMMMVSVPIIGFTQGYVPVISYNYGHGNVERVKQGFKYGFIIITSLNMLIVIVMMTFPETFARIFTDDEQLIKTVGEMLPIFMAGMLVFGIQRTCQNTFLALVQPKISLFIALLRKVILLVPLAIILPKLLDDVVGVYLAEAVADATAAICCGLIFMYKFPKIIKAMKNDTAK